MISTITDIVSKHSGWALAAICAVFSIAAAFVAAWPAWRARGTALLPRALLAAAIATFVIGVGGGAYLVLGRPELAERALRTPESRGVRGLIAELARRIRDRPNDVTGWMLLGRGYLTLNDPQQAAIAFRHASQIATPQQMPELLSSWGEALTLAAGAVTPDAEAAFRSALARDPKDFAARFYLGQAYAERRDTAQALAMWRGLLADAPAHAPWRAELVDRIAALQGRPGAVVDIYAMVAGLAARLHAQPNDPPGWEHLVRAYTVLGEPAKARSALENARAALRDRPQDLAILQTEARTLKLER
jgi:cytochrome c-type biogenesis protein CcmH